MPLKFQQVEFKEILFSFMTKPTTYVSFDIDGTLVLGHNALKEHHGAFQRAVSEMFGECGMPIPFLGHPVDGWMDMKIIEAMIKKLGVEYTPEQLQKCLSLSEDYYCAAATQKSEVLPGIEHLLQVLSEMPNVEIGIASGNLPRIAWHKLELSGIAKYFKNKLGGFGVVENRNEAVKASRKNAEEFHHTTFKTHIHVGDTPSDITAGQYAGAIPVAVRTGLTNWESFPQPCHEFKNLDVDFNEFMKLIDSQ